MSVNVLAIAGEKIFILRKDKCQRRTANLLLIANDEKKHYVTIKNLSQLLRSSNSKHHHQQHFCLNCLQGFHSIESRNKHFEYQIDYKAVRIDMPEPNSFMRFHSGQYQFKVAFITDTDFEAILQNLEDETELDPEAPYTREINHHSLSGFCMYTIFVYRKVDNPLRLYQDKDCMEVNGVARCCICLEHFEMWEEKVRDHCHYTGKYRGATL